MGGGPLQIGTVFTALSGRPFTYGQGTTDNSGQAVGTIRANCLADPIYNWDLDYLFPDANTTRSVITNAAQAFGNPPTGTLGTCGRNTGRRAGFAALDLNRDGGLDLKELSAANITRATAQRLAETDSDL